MKIAAEPRITFNNGRTLWLAAEAGTVPAMHLIDSKALVVDERFGTGALMLADPSGVTILGPVDYDQVIVLARAVVEGDRKVLTKPTILLMLASALLALDQERQG